MDQSLPCSDSELKLLRDELKTTIKGLKIGAGIAIIIAVIMPWLGSSKTHGKPMVDFMSYPNAILFIILIMGFILFTYYFMTVPKIKSDLMEKKKLVLKTTIAKKETVVYRRIKGAYITLNSAPGRVNRVALTPMEFEEFKEKDEVIVEYFKNSKKIIKVTNLRTKNDDNVTKI